jgi:hypothetical protein
MTINKEDILLKKLDVFIKKYHTNQLIKGVFFFLLVFLSYFIVLTVLEYFNRFGVEARRILFFTSLFAILVITVIFILIPLSKLLKIGKHLSYEDAAKSIGSFFPEVNDKLLNTLQLAKQSKEKTQEVALLLASIEQKTIEISPIPFVKAIDLKSTKKILKLALIPLLVIVLLSLFSPAIIADSTKRILDYNTQYIPPAPFEFSIKNKSLKTSTQQDFTLEVELNGSELPDQVYLETGKTKFRLKKESKNSFTYEFKNIQKSIDFQFFADGFYSKTFQLEAVPKPDLKSFVVFLDYPTYTGIKDEKLNNVGDLTVVQGTKIKWMLNTENIDEFNFLIQDSAIFKEKNPKQVLVDFRAMTNTAFGWIWKNNTLQSNQQTNYQLQVIPDQYPTIQLNEVQDSITFTRLFFTGNVEDDYGFKSLNFQFELKRGNVIVNKKTEAISLSNSLSKSNFYHAVDFSQFNPEPGDEITYFFEIADNDEVNGSKKTRSTIKNLQIPTLEQLKELNEKQNETIKADLNQSIIDLKKIQKEIDELNMKLLQQKELNWQDKKKMQDLLDKQKQLQQKIEETIDKNKNTNKQQEQFKQQEENLLEKQKELEKMFEKILSPEMKEKLKEIEKALENMDKNKMKDMLEKMKFDNKDLQKELDRQLELFKQLEFDKKLDETINKLDQLAEKQEKLSEESKKNDNKDLKEEQQKLNKEFDDLRKDLDDLEKKNKELESPTDLKDTEKQEQDIQQDQQNSEQDLKSGKNSKASKSQKSAADKMKEMSKQLKEQQEQNEADQQEEDLNQLRELLENVVQLSFDQERLMKSLQKTAINNPQYVQIIQQQKKIKDDAAMIEDSLLALSKRVAQIKSFINKEIGAVNMNMEKSLNHLSERQTPQALSRQQFVMTSLNNLALMLSEVTEQMQKQMAEAQKKPGSGECKKPGKKGKPGQGKPSMATMKALQQQLNEQLEKLKQGMQNPNGKGGMGQKGMSEQLARMAAQQEAIRNELQKMMGEMMKEGNNGSTGQLQEILNKMDKTETDLVNKNLTQETLKRQQEIMTKLLEAEKAERERDEDEKRKSNENKDDFKRNIAEFLQYNRLIERETEILKTISPQMKPFYKNLVKEYFNTQN